MKPTVTLGVTGSIAAYKAADLTSQLTKQKCDVQVIMTESATKLVTPMTFQTLSRNPVMSSIWDEPQWKPGHISWADRTSLFVVAPATANTLAKMAHGIADDALSTFALSYDGPVLVAPAMNPRMWQHPATQANVKLLEERGVKFVHPTSGLVACGDFGQGKLAPVETILHSILELLPVTNS